ncbi:MAG: GerW family sporulation protein [bacterium]
MDHKISTLLKVSMESIKDMIDVNTIIGEAIHISDDTKVIPISRVRLGFLSGGSEIKQEVKELEHPFGGGTGGTMSITPIAFLICNNNDIRILHLEQQTHLYEKVIDYMPSITSKITDLFKDISIEKKI